MYDEDDYLMLSGIQHFCFCRRQWALIHMEQLWEDDDRTMSGNIFHDKADEVSKEVRKDVVIRRAVRVSSSSLGLSGRCDVVEFVRNQNGHEVDGLEGRYQVIPVEYKVGRRKSEDWDRIQLCAEAIALEESLHTVVEEGCLYYGKERRREVVPMSEDLRQKTSETAADMHSLYDQRILPRAEPAPHCNKCSLSSMCLPGLNNHEDVSSYLSRMAEE